MNFSLYTDYPWWFLFFCILSGAGYSFVLYGREKRFNETRKWVKTALAVLRFLSVTFIAFFLLSPLLRNISRTVEKPILIFAQDNSESLIFGKSRPGEDPSSGGDSTYYKGEYLKNISGLVSSLADKYDTNIYSFGDQIKNGFSFDFKEKQTDIAVLFDEIETKFSNRNVGAVILASDGLYNKGQNPLYASSQNKFPVYTIALGDTTIQKDLVLSKALHNRIAYLGNKFPVEIQIAARQLGTKVSVCTVSKGESVLFTRQVIISGNNFSTSIPVHLDAKETGLQRYTIRLSGVDGEVSYSNNAKDIFIDVLDGRQKVLILASAPHPDIAAIKNALESNENYEVNSFTTEDFSKPIADYNLVILHQLPSSKSKAEKILADIDKANIPVLFILGSQISVSMFNNVQSELSVPASGGKMNEATPVVSKDFSLFTVSDALRNYSSKFSPLQCPFGNYKVNSSVSTLFNQKIGLVETEVPLMFFSQYGDQKKGVICGEGIWRWSLQDFSEHGNSTIFNELVTKTVQYLSAKIDKSLFRVALSGSEGSKNNFYENESVEFEAEVYNDSYELINAPDISVSIINSDEKSFPFTFNKTANAYRLNAGQLPIGSYRYEAKVKVGAKIYTEKGEFGVAALQVETTNTVADHQLLYALAKKSGGEMVYPDQVNKLAEILNAREDIKPISHSEKKLSDMINLKWIFFLLLSLISMEWFMRKINGAY
ncbi:MAG: hypothetical protein EPN85_01110 [Bacteroidetes bacterium]|nr:MAG: hypothetical protein EPN85_01110 [Bacteroidota bacterium]